MASGTPAPARTAPAAPIARWAGLLAVLLVELVIIGFLVEKGTRSGQVEWWTLFLQNHALGRVCFASLAAMLLISAKRFWDESPHQSAQFWRYAPFWPVLLGQLLLFGGFAGFTALVLQKDMELSSWPGGWGLAWGVLGLTSLALWGAAALPVGLWQWLRRRGWVVFLPSLAVGAAAVAAGKLSEQLYLPLGLGALWLVRSFFTLAGVETIYEPAKFLVGVWPYVEAPPFVVKVTPACSGYQGMGLICVFLAVYLWLFRRDLRFPRALLLFPLGVLLACLANVLRLIALVAIGGWVSAEVAIGGFHSQAGWLAFLAVALGLATVAQRSRYFSAAVAPAETVETAAASGPANPVAPYLVPLLVLIAVSMLTGAFAAKFDHGYPLRVLAVAGALWFFRHQYKDLRWTWSWTAVALGAAVFVLWIVLEPVPSAADASAIPDRLDSMPGAWAAVWLTFRVVGSVVTVPLAEELAFRGYLTRQLMAAKFEDVPLGRFGWVSFLLSSALFGALHGRWLAGTLAGMLYALALYRRRQLVDPVVAHATTNALLAAYVLTTGSWALW